MVYQAPLCTNIQSIPYSILSKLSLHDLAKMVRSQIKMFSSGDPRKKDLIFLFINFGRLAHIAQSQRVCARQLENGGNKTAIDRNTTLRSIYSLTLDFLINLAPPIYFQIHPLIVPAACVGVSATHEVVNTFFRLLDNPLSLGRRIVGAAAKLVGSSLGGGLLIVGNDGSGHTVVCARKSL
jgi:hypothetical protein